MSVEYSLRLKRELRSHFGYVLPLGYTNSIVGYIPVKRQIPEWGYEVWDANQYEHLTGPYVAQTEEQIVNALHRALE
jgi:neutral ceramidase